MTKTMSEVRPGKVIAEQRIRLDLQKQRIAQLENIILRAKQALTPFGSVDMSKLRVMQILTEACERPGERRKRLCSTQQLETSP